MTISVDEEMPGGPMTNRPVHFFWLLDQSSSMGGSKITQLNWAIREALPDMQAAARSNPAAKLMVRALTFGSGARWHDKQAVEASAYTWSDVRANGSTDMGAAFKLVAAELTALQMPQRALRPVLALVSDGQPTDDWRSGLRMIDSSSWGQRAVRVAIAIGNDADTAMLKVFLNNAEDEPLKVHDAAQLAAAIRWASTMAVRAASHATGAGTPGSSPLAGTAVLPPVSAGDVDVW